MRRERPFRSYRIERDESGLRLVWQGDYRKVPVDYVTCPRCAGNSELKDGRCLTCWHDWRGESQWVPV